MAIAQQTDFVSEAEYLAAERLAQELHESKHAKSHALSIEPDKPYRALQAP